MVAMKDLFPLVEMDGWSAVCHDIFALALWGFVERFLSLFLNAISRLSTNDFYHMSAA